MKAAKLLAVLAIAAILVMGVGTYVLLSAAPAVKQYAPSSTTEGRVTAYVVPSTSAQGHVYVNVLP